MKNDKSGFTLIELLVVLAIIGIILALTVISITNMKQNTQNAKRVSDVKEIQSALELYRSNEGDYPPSITVGQALIATSSTTTYMSMIPSGLGITNADLCPGTDYTYTKTDHSYTINFCLTKPTGYLSAGPKCATPKGILDLDCSGWIPGQVNCGPSTVNYGGLDYHVINIGTQCWFKESLNVGTRVNGSTNQGDYSAGIQKYCYDDNETNCTNEGGLYQWHMVAGRNQACDSLNCASFPSDPCCDNVTGNTICPTGWHVSTDAELTALDTSVGSDANKLKASAPDWNGNNSSGFSALPTGYREIDASYFVWGGLVGYFWSSTMHIDAAWDRGLYTTFDRNVNDKRLGLSVRCIKN